MKVKNIIIVGFISYIVVILSSFPATLFVKMLPLEKHNIQLSGVSGSVWKGGVDVLKKDKLILEGFSWDINFLHLFLLSLNLDLQAKSFNQLFPSFNFNLDISPFGITVKNLSFDASFSYFQKIFPFLKMSLMGNKVNSNISVKSDIIKYDISKSICISSPINIYLIGTSVKSSFGSFDFGNSAFLANCSDKGYKVNLSKKDNPIGLAFDFILDYKFTYNLNVTLEPTESFPAKMLSFLPMIMEKKSDSVYALNKKGSLNNFVK